ncbi:MAG: YidB family protein [Burkholderiaceae bacterium]
MGLLDSLIGAATQGAMESMQGDRSQAGAASAGGLNPQMIMGLVTLVLNNAGGLQGLLAKLQSAGLGQQAQSWVGTGANQPVAPDALGGALGPDLMGMIASQLGGSTQQASATMADLLPDLIDRVTPQGQMPADDGLGALGALLGGGQSGSPGAADLMGMLGGMLGRR